MGHGWQMPKMEREILMSKESENIVRQWEEQKQIQKMDKPFMKLFMEVSKPKPQPVRNQTASKPQKKKK